MLKTLKELHTESLALKEVKLNILNSQKPLPEEEDKK